LHKDCFHKALLTVKNKLESIWEQVNILREELGDPFSCEDVWSQSKLDYRYDPRWEPLLMGQSDQEAIHFNMASAGRPGRVAYNSKLQEDLSLWELDAMGHHRKCRLRQSLFLEHYLRMPLTELKHGTLSQQSALSLVINTISCTVCLENWVAVKLFIWLLHLGLDYAKLAGDLPGCDTNSSEGGRLKQLLAQVEDVIKNKMLG
jgi:hypothetical protein